MMQEGHWLFRLPAADWIRSGEHELELARDASRSRRKVLTHLRRGAGMALNGVLVAAVEAKSLEADQAEVVWGRSYVEHLRRCGDAASPAPALPPEVSAAAQTLMSLPLNDPERLVRLGGGHGPAVEAAIEQAGLMLDWAKAYTEAIA
jgi:hypothetical protein